MSFVNSGSTTLLLCTFHHHRYAKHVTVNVRDVSMSIKMSSISRTITKNLMLILRDVFVCKTTDPFL